MIPLYGFLAGDTIGLLILAQETDLIADVARKLEQAARVRVAPTGTVRITHAGRRLDPQWTVREAGLAALDRIDGVPDSPRERSGERAPE